jgi:hypothetical protein
MDNNKTANWLIIAVALGLFAFSGSSMYVNGFRFYLMYPVFLGIINLAAIWLMKK